MNAIVKEKIPQLVELCKKYRVVRFYVFGSAARGHDFDPATSDIDFLYAFDPALTIEEYGDNFFDFLFALEDLFGKNIDMLAEKCLSNPYLIESVNEDKQLIYEAVA